MPGEAAGGKLRAAAKGSGMDREILGFFGCKWISVAPEMLGDTWPLFYPLAAARSCVEEQVASGGVMFAMRQCGNARQSAFGSLRPFQF